MLADYRIVVVILLLEIVRLARPLDESGVRIAGICKV